MPVLSVSSAYAADRETIVRAACDIRKTEYSWASIDLTVALTTFPALVVLTLLLDFNLTGDWTERNDTTIFVLVLIGAFITVSTFTFSYISYRLGCRLWAGPQDGGGPIDANHSWDAATVSAMAAAQMYIINMEPPSYELAIGMVQADEDAELPSYESLLKPGSGAVHHI